MSSVFLIWNEEDYYTPRLVEVCATQEVADAVQHLLNAPYRARCRAVGNKPGTDWPHSIEEREVTEP